MSQDYTDLRALDFSTISETKAKLSEKISRLATGRRLAITNDGRPTAVLLSYEDFLSLLNKLENNPGPEGRVIDFEAWKSESGNRAKVRDSILSLFDVKALSRKGQKSYKKDAVDGFVRRNRKD